MKRQHSLIKPTTRAITVIGYWLTVIVLASCGDYLEFGTDEDPSEEPRLALAQHAVTLMAGDSCRLTATFTPDDGKEHTVFWLSEGDTIARMSKDTVVAVATGETLVRCFNITGTQQDSCTVSVIPQWVIDPYAWSNDMVVYASVTVDSTTDSDRFIVGAFVGDELRGLGTLLTKGSRKYWAIRVYSNTDPYDSNTIIEVPEGEVPADKQDPEKVTFRCYERGKGTISEFPVTIDFDGMAHGTLSSLFLLKIGH